MIVFLFYTKRKTKRSHRSGFFFYWRRKWKRMFYYSCFNCIFFKYLCVNLF